MAPLDSPGAKQAEGEQLERRAFEVLIVCTGNSCRSPMAEGLLKHLLAGAAAAGDRRAAAIRVSSAGTHAPAGSPATLEAREACAALGIDLSAHRARQATPEILAASNLILVMEPFHLAGVYVRDAEAARKAVLLTEFAGEAGSDGVPDPIGAPAAVYRETCARLEALLRASLPRLLDLAERVGQS
jgi:protein-tyrosine-phosphatase